MPHNNVGQYYEFAGVIPLPLHSLREANASGTVGNIVANGGILASDTTPIMRNTSGLISQEISWAASNSDPIVTQHPLPADFDGRSPVTIEMWVNSGTTDAASFTFATSWDGGATVSTSVTDGAKSATYHKITAVIPASSVPDGASMVTVLMTPAAHTTDPINLQNVRLLYAPKATQN